MNDPMRSRLRAGRAVLTLLLAIAAATVARAADPAALPIFDAHLHYNWEPAPHFPLDKVLALFRQNDVTGILATSRPNDGTRALVEAKPMNLWVVPFIRPYRVRADIQTWMNDPAIHLPMTFNPGDMQFLHNHQVFHARSEFENWPEPERPRHLLRLWLCAKQGRPLPRAFEPRYGSIAPGDRGGIVVRNTRFKVPLEPE